MISDLCCALFCADDFVGECLISAIKSTLGDAATKEIIDAWTAAYGFLAHLFIETEKKIKAEAEKQAGYSGVKKMKVTKIAEGKEGVKSLWMVPDDGKIPGHKAGQFLAVSLPDVPGIGKTMVTLHIDEESTTELRLRVPKNDERATTFLYERVNVDSILDVGVPVGVPKPPKSDSNSE